MKSHTSVARHAVASCLLILVTFLVKQNESSITVPQVAYLWRRDADWKEIRPVRTLMDNSVSQLDLVHSSLANASIVVDENDLLAMAYEKMNDEQKITDIILSTEINSDGSWSKSSNNWKARWRNTCVSGRDLSTNVVHYNCQLPPTVVDDPVLDVLARPPVLSAELAKNASRQKPAVVRLECGKSTNFTVYDHLVGVQNRFKHPSVDEVADMLSLFGEELNASLPQSKKDGVPIIEAHLRRLKQSSPLTASGFVKLANYWRLRGQSLMAIECFRQALALSPHDASALLHLGRLLFNLHYVDDALILTRLSLDIVVSSHSIAQSPSAVDPREIDLEQLESQLSALSRIAGVSHGTGGGAAALPLDPQILMVDDIDQELLMALQSDQLAEDLKDSIDLVGPVSAWRQHLQMGEILADYSQHGEAVLHLNHALRLNPDCKSAKTILARLESGQDVSVHIVTVAIILALISMTVYWLVQKVKHESPDSHARCDDGGSGGRQHYNNGSSRSGNKSHQNKRNSKPSRRL